MSEQIQPNPDRIPERKPFHRVEWNGSVAEIYDSAPMLDAPGNEVYVYDRSDFQTPIERTQISVQRVEIDGEAGTAFTARIRLDRTRNDYDRGVGMSAPLLAPLRRNSIGQVDFIPYRNQDKDLTIEPTVFSNVHKVSHTGGGKFLVWVDADKRLITVSNSLSLSSTNANGEQKNQVVVTPQVDSTVDQTAILDGFFKATMRTLDFTAGLTDYRAADARLKRTYAIGKEISDARPPKPASNIGRSALAGSQPPKTQSTSTSKTEQRTNLTEDLPEIEIVESKLTLDDVGGLEQVKRTLRDIATSFQHPEVMEKWGATRPQGVLMYGEPGTGKTMLAQALANEIDAEMWALQSTDIYEKWLGNSESHIKDIFSRARQHQGRLILFFDEFDSIVGITESPSGGGADNARNAVAGIFKQEMNTLAKDNPDVLVVAATNNLDRIDPALIRSGRFDHKVYIPMPDEDARQQIIAGIAAKSMLQQESEGFKVFGDDLNIVKLAGETDGMSGADISELFRRLGLSRAMQEARTGEQQPPISQDEIEQEIRRFRTAG